MNYCWETPLSCQIKPLESRDACGGEFIPIKPCHRTHQINRRGNPKMVQVRFGKADIAGAAHAKGTHSLGNRRFDPLSQRILLGKGWRLRPRTGCLERFMLGVRSAGEAAPLVLLFRADTVDLARTASRMSSGGRDLDHLIGQVVDGGSAT